MRLDAGAGAPGPGVAEVLPLPRPAPAGGFAGLPALSLPAQGSAAAAVTRNISSRATLGAIHLLRIVMRPLRSATLPGIAIEPEGAHLEAHGLSSVGGPEDLDGVAHGALAQELAARPALPRPAEDHLPGLAPDLHRGIVNGERRRQLLLHDSREVLACLGLDGVAEPGAQVAPGRLIPALPLAGLRLPRSATTRAAKPSTTASGTWAGGARPWVAVM